MKRLSISGLLAIVFFLAACNENSGGNTTTPAATTDTKSDDGQHMLEASRAVYRAMETGDSATLHKYIASDAVDHGGGPNGTDIKGEEIVKMLSTVHNDIDNLKLEVIEEAASDDHIFTLVRMTGTTNKPVWGMPANHKIDTRSVDVVKVRDGKMVDHWGFFDQAEMMKMMSQQGGGEKAGGGQ